MAPDKTVRDTASEGDKELIQLVLDYRDQLTSRRWIFEREWYRNILYYLGQQWIVYEDGHRRWRRRNLPNWVPLPVTNRLASTANVIRSSVAQVTPAFVATPAREDEKSVLSANAADKYLDLIVRESGFRGARRRLASWVTLTGNGFLVTEFDTSQETGVVRIPGEVCTECQTKIPPAAIREDLRCPQCGSEALMEDESIGTDVPQGRLSVRALSPFEVYVDPAIMELEDQPAVLLIESRSLDQIRQTYGEAADEVGPDNESSTGRYMLDSLNLMTATGFSGGGYRMGTSHEGSGNVTLYKLFIKYCKKYPKGAYIVMTGDQHILEKHPEFPFVFKATKKPFYPLVHIRYDDVPGRFWAKTPIDDLCLKQKQRNEIESLFQTILMRTANPVWLLPHGVQTTPITGDPGIVVRYSGAAGLKPERLQGLEAPQSIVAFIQQIDSDFEEIANTFAVMKGKNPGSVRAASAIQMLMERGFGRYGSVFDNLEEAYEQWGIQALEIWRQKAIFPRVQAVAKAAGAWQFTEFLGSDIGEVDIRVEAGSTRPKSQAGRQMLVGQMLQWGLLNPNDPEQRMKIFEQLGATELLPGAEADIKVVAEENAKFMEWAQQVKKAVEAEGADGDPEAALQAMFATFPLEGNPILDHHPTHLVHHRRLALSDAFRELPKPIQDMFVQHILQAHYLFMFQEQLMGMGATGTMAGLAMTQAKGSAGPPGNPGQSTPKTGQPALGAGPGGSVGPFGDQRGGQM